MVALLQKASADAEAADAVADVPPAPPTLAWNLPHTCIFQSDIVGRGLHSSTFRHNVSAFCGTGGAYRGRSKGV